MTSAPEGEAAAPTNRRARARQVNTLLLGTALAQAVPLLASPLLTRLFGPQAFGELALYASAVALTAVVASGRFELAIVLPKTDAEARSLAWLALILAAAVCVALLAAALVFHALGGRRVGSFAVAGSSLREWTVLVPLATFLSAALAVFGAWANRQARYRLLAVDRALQSLLVAAASIACGWLGYERGGLVYASFAGLLAAVVVLGAGLVWGSSSPPRAPPLGPWRAVPGAELAAVARRFGNFPRLNLPHALLDQLQTVALLALIASVWGAVALGLYAFVLRMLRAPLATIGSSYGQVFHQHAARTLTDGGALLPLVRDQLRSMSLWLLPVAAVALAGPWLFADLFGAGWRESGVYAAILLPSLAIGFMVAPLAPLPLVLGLQRQAFVWGAAYNATMLVSLVVAAALRFELREALLLHTVCVSLVLAGYGRWLLRIARGADLRG